ncbi:MAG TPA: carboxypeptidase regulatory-like domain-containing protein [Polyangiaceae bacterium]|nr:carboxypeptidase regulatory-like domain-containing protein [Polyangiaceae bacterium]
MERRKRSNGRLPALLVGLVAIFGLLRWMVGKGVDEPVHRLSEQRGTDGRAETGAQGRVLTAESEAGPAGALARGVGVVRGRVRSAGAGEPLSGVVLCGVALADGERRCAEADTEGRFLLELPLGRHRLALDSESVLLSGCRLGQDPTIVSLTPLLPAVDVELAAVGAGQIIEGLVLDRYGGVVEGALVEEGQPGELDGGALGGCGVAVTDEEGRFRLPATGGLLSLRASAAGYGVASVDDASARELVTMTLAPEGRLRGVAVRTESGDAIDGAEIHVLRDSAAGWLPVAGAQSGTNGRFLVGGLAAGRYRVEAAADGLFGIGDVVDVSPGEEEEIRLELAQGGQFVASLGVGEGGVACELGHVTLVHDVLGLRFASAADDGGLARIRGLPPGRYVAAASCRGLEVASGPETVEVNAADESPSQGVWLFTQGGALRGEVIALAGGEPLRGAQVVVLSADERAGVAPASAITDERGSFVMPMLAAGSYEVLLPELPNDEEPVVAVVRPGDETKVVVQVAAHGTIQGEAHDRHGNPCVGLEVRAASSGFRSARVDARGQFRVDGLAPSEYRVGFADPSLDAAEPTSVRVPPSGEATVSLTCVAHDATLGGRAVDGEGDPLADVLVEATPLNGDRTPEFERTTRTVLVDADGRFEIGGLVDGRYLVTLRSSAGLELGHAIGETGEGVEVVAHPTATVTGAVVSRDRELSGPIIVELDRAEGDVRRRAVAHPADGGWRWRVDGLPFGRYRVEARAASGEVGSLERVVDGSNESFEVMLRAVDVE